jgi:hypothetical protein
MSVPYLETPSIEKVRHRHRCYRHRHTGMFFREVCVPLMLMFMADTFNIVALPALPIQWQIELPWVNIIRHLLQVRRGLAVA